MLGGKYSRRIGTLASPACHRFSHKDFACFLPYLCKQGAINRRGRLPTEVSQAESKEKWSAGSGSTASHIALSGLIASLSR
jgi:hypothetical protein